jgi:hypothetical protein
MKKELTKINYKAIDSYKAIDNYRDIDNYKAIDNYRDIDSYKDTDDKLDDDYTNNDVFKALMFVGYLIFVAVGSFLITLLTKGIPVIGTISAIITILAFFGILVAFYICFCEDDNF